MACHGLCLPSDRNFIADLTAPEKKKSLCLKIHNALGVDSSKAL